MVIQGMLASCAYTFTLSKPLELLPNDSHFPTAISKLAQLPRPTYFLNGLLSPCGSWAIIHCPIPSLSCSLWSQLPCLLLVIFLRWTRFCSHLFASNFERLRVWFCSDWGELNSPEISFYPLMGMGIHVAGPYHESSTVNITSTLPIAHLWSNMFLLCNPSDLISACQRWSACKGILTVCD